MSAKKPWTVPELQAIRVLPAGGLAELAKRLGRTVTAIRVARHKRGFADPRPHWTDDELALYERNVTGYGTIQTAARVIGRTRKAAYTRRYRESHNDGENDDTEGEASGIGQTGS